MQQNKTLSRIDHAAALTNEQHKACGKKYMEQLQTVMEQH